MLLPPPISTLTYTPFPSTTPFRSRYRGDDFGLGHLGMFGKFRAQVFLSVVQRVLHQRRVGTCEGRTQLREVFGNGVHAEGPWRTESTESRVARQASAQATRTSRPTAVMR